MQDEHLCLSGPWRKSPGLLAISLYVTQEEEAKHGRDVTLAASPGLPSSLPSHQCSTSVPITMASHTHAAHRSATGPLLMPDILSGCSH